MNNRIIANGGTNLAGGIGIFAGADGYVVSGNDICGNFSAEYGGGVTVYGRSPSGSIDHNRIYYNQSYDEGGGIMIAGELPTDPSILSPGSGPVDIHDNLIQANLANDDGGGIRFLMAGNFPMNVFNNMIVNNVSTHEGGGIALDDAPNVRIYNNTIMKNVTTATAVTSDGQPAPAGLSTGQNSALLQATLPGGSPTFSNPLLFNNIFWDNRAGTRAAGTVTGIGDVAMPDPLGHGRSRHHGRPLPDELASCRPDRGRRARFTYPTGSANNVSTDPQVKSIAYDTVAGLRPVADEPELRRRDPRRGRPPAEGPGRLPPLDDTSPAFNAGAASKAVAGLPAAAVDAARARRRTSTTRPGRPSAASTSARTRSQPRRPTSPSPRPTASTSVSPGGALTYTIVVTNTGPDAGHGRPVTDTFPASLTVGSWTLHGHGRLELHRDRRRATPGPARSTLVSGGSATFTATVTLAAGATGSLANTATVAAPAGITDPNAANNSATDTDVDRAARPTLGVLDNFNRANATTLGRELEPDDDHRHRHPGQRQPGELRLAGNCLASRPATAIWNGPTNVFGTRQGAAITFTSTPVAGHEPVPEGQRRHARAAPQNFIRVRYTGSGSVVVETTTNSGGTYTDASGPSRRHSRTATP